MGIVGWIITGIFVGIILGAVLKMIKKKQRDKKGTKLKHKSFYVDRIPFTSLTSVESKNEKTFSKISYDPRRFTDIECVQPTFVITTSNTTFYVKSTEQCALINTMAYSIKP